MTRRGVEANGEMCRIYLRGRSADDAADLYSADPGRLTTGCQDEGADHAA